MDPTTDCDCKETIHKKARTYNTWDTNCNLSTLFILLLIAILFSLFKIKSSPYLFILLAISLLLLSAFGPNPVQSIPSTLFTATQFSPEYLPPSQYFSDYVYLQEESAFRTIKDEVTSLLFTSTLHPSAQNKDGSKIFPIKSGSTFTLPFSSKVPFLATFLENHPDIISCSIRVLKPGSVLPLNEVNYKGLIKYTLPIHVRQKSPIPYLCVNGKKCEWEEGDGVLWDGNFSNKAYNQSSQQCVLIDMEIVRPLSGWMDKVNRKVISTMYRR